VHTGSHRLPVSDSSADMTGNRDSSTAESEPPTDSPSDQTAPSSGPIDPAQLADDPAVEFAERVYPHGDADHCEADARGRAVVGLTREDGAVLVTVDDDADHALLVHDTVAPDEGFRAVAREAAAAVANTPVSIEDPVAVRRVEHYATDDQDAVGDPEAFEAADADPHNVTHHVVFGASLAAGHDDRGAREDGTDEREGAAGDASAAEGAIAAIPAPSVDHESWSAGWFQEIPVDLADEDGDAVDDLRRFVD